MPGTALVTGGAGFIGSHLVDALLSEGREVAVVDDLSSGKASNVASGATLHQLDVVDAGALEEVAAEVRPDAIWHLAAQASVTASVANPRRDLEVNVVGTLNVLEVARELAAPVVVTSTGGALYGDDAPLPTPEDRLPEPLAPYGASKLAAEAYIRTWSASSGLPHAICRLGNVYGPRQNPHGEAGVVAIFSHHLRAGTSPKMFGHGRPTRDYVYVGDVVRALIAASGKAGTFNVATEAQTDVMTLWSELKQVAGSDVEPHLLDLRPGELQRSCLAIGRARAELGWSPEVQLPDGLRQTYEALVAEFDWEEQA